MYGILEGFIENDAYDYILLIFIYNRFVDDS